MVDRDHSATFPLNAPATPTRLPNIYTSFLSAVSVDLVYSEA